MCVKGGNYYHTSDCRRKKQKEDEAEDRTDTPSFFYITCYEEGGLQRDRGASDSTADALVGPGVAGLDGADEQRAVGKQGHAVETCVRQVTTPGSPLGGFPHLLEQTKLFFCPVISPESPIF